MQSDTITYMKVNFSENLKNLREEKGLSQRQLAEEIKVSQANISRWEKGTQSPSIEWLIIIAQFFDVTTDYLLGLED